MATRRKSSGFTAPGEEKTSDVKELLDEEEREMFETFSQTADEIKEEKEVEVKVELPTPVILPEIAPTEDIGPRFVDDLIISKPVPTPKAQASVNPPPPKRHPRNIPKFSRYK